MFEWIGCFLLVGTLDIRGLIVSFKVSREEHIYVDRWRLSHSLKLRSNNKGKRPIFNSLLKR